MDVPGVVSELYKGLRQTRPYLLAHHQPAHWHHCYAPTVFGRRIRVCARCLGIYPGIILGILVFERGLPADTRFLLIFLLPIPAVVDWTRTAFTARVGSNASRTLTGGLLGSAYGLGLPAVLIGGELRVLGVGVMFGGVAVVLLLLEKSPSA